MLYTGYRKGKQTANTDTCPRRYFPEMSAKMRGY